MAWVTKFAPATTELNECIDCGLCLPVCPTYRVTGDESASPRGRIAAMRAVDSGVIGVDERFAEVMDLCLQCRACEVACPSLVQFGRMMEGARAEATAQVPDWRSVATRTVFGRAVASRSAVVMLAWLVGVTQRSHLATVLPGAAKKVTALRRVPLPIPVTAGHEWLPDGEPIGTVAFLAGCVMDQWYSDVHVAVIQVLRTAGYRVVAPSDQTCCGALAAHEGAAYDAARMAEQNVEAFAGYDLVVVDSAGCSAFMKGYDHWADSGADLASRVIDANEFIATLIDEGSLPTISGGKVPIAIQDPCHLRHVQRIIDEPRDILRAAGYEPVEIDAAGMCCGAAGAYQLSHPEMSDELGRLKATQVEATGLSRVASANPGCEMQLKTFLADGIEVVHPIEVYWSALVDRQQTTDNSRTRT
ncbi:MAG: (Fe-S)-binding protein [Actinomycetota bacterium]|nr:(Fe-S)-binding protein [Actinomycetota bacterium]